MYQRRAAALLLTLALSASAPAAASAQSTTARVVRAANAFLTTLDTAQRRRVMFAFTDDEQRRRWSNFPTGFVPRAGLNLREMSAPQRTAALALMSTVLSTRGYEKVQQIMTADEVFKTTSQNGRGRGGPPNGGPPNGAPPAGGRRGGPPGGAGGGDAMFGSDLYYISFLGTPSETAPWMLQYGGHHLALNITIVGERGILTPTLTGAQPSLYTLDGKTVRPLAGESDKALALLNTLDASQRSQAILKYDVSDLVLGPGEDGKTIVPEGMKVSTMNATQRAMLLDVIKEWVGIINDNAAAARMKELSAELDQTYFAWSGATTAAPGQNITGYYRIQGPHLVIEFAPQRDDPSLHVHTIYRDPTNDYGRGTVGK
ncbi:MAG TPA: DUF3500 domain-containing protein [Gemmatimonadaceae bacterium]|jgi:hypothetical protein